MDRIELLAAATLLLAQARALRDRFPDAAALAALPVAELPPARPGGAATLRAALVCLREEMLLVRQGRAGALNVLEDEMVFAASLLPRDAGRPVRL